MWVNQKNLMSGRHIVIFGKEDAVVTEKTTVNLMIRTSSITFDTTP
jgi:hypothetical protein